MNLIKSLTAAVMFLASAASLQAQVFYKVEGNGLSSPSYIFGTHHLAPLAVAEKFGAMAHFAETSQVVGEIDMTQDQMAMAMEMQSHMMAPADSTLSKVISPEDFKVINEEFKKLSPMPGMDLSMLEVMKPMAITTMVAVGIASEAMPGYNPEEQLDTYFQTRAKDEGKKIVPLETVGQQASILFDTTPISYQAESLVEMLKDPKEAIESARSLTEAYMAQDLEKMLELSQKEDEHPEFMKALLDRRNADWLSKLPALFAEAPSFVAVGALHLAGDLGLVEGLRRLGYKVTPIQTSAN